MDIIEILQIIDTTANAVRPVNVSEREAQIKALVDRKIKALIKEHEEEISGEASIFTRNYFGKEFTVEEYKSMISELEEKFYKYPPECSTPNLRAEYKNTVEKEIGYIKSDMQRMLDFQEYLRRAEEEIYEKYPLNISQLIENVKKYIEKSISYHIRDITDVYHDSFMEKVMNLCPKDGKDYSKRIEQIFKNRVSIKSMDTIYNFFNILKYKLTITVSMFNNYDGNEYDKLQELLKSEINKLITDFYLIITDFVAEHIDCIEAEEMTSIPAVTTFANYCIREMNHALLRELPDVLNDVMIDKFEYRMECLIVRCKDLLGFDISKVEAKAHAARTESLTREAKPSLTREAKPSLTREAKPSPSISYSEESSNVEVVITEPQVEDYAVSSKPKRDFTEFLKTIGHEPIVAEDLVRLYNNYFGDNVNILSLGKRAEIKKNFKVHREMRSGKKVSVYVKI